VFAVLRFNSGVRWAWKQAPKLSARHSVEHREARCSGQYRVGWLLQPVLLLVSHGIFSEAARSTFVILAAATALLEAVTCHGRPTLQSILVL
jgi:hypothetical protein